MPRSTLRSCPRHRLAPFGGLVLALAAMGGCGTQSHPPGRDGGAEGGRDAARDATGDAARDAGADATWDGGACTLETCPVPCGDVSCGPGQVCCPACGERPSGICADRMDLCPVFDCPPPPVEICGDAPCGPGETCCREVCPGQRPYCTSRPDTCVPRPCPPPMPCGTDECPPGQLCCPGCPGEPPTGICADRLDACPPLDCPPPPGACAPMDAAGRGRCAGVLGFAWNGSACVPISGCRCVGADCDRLFTSRAACEDHYLGVGCIHDCRSTGCPAGTSCQLCFTSWDCIPDGAVC